MRAGRVAAVAAYLCSVCVIGLEYKPQINLFSGTGVNAFLEISARNRGEYLCGSFLIEDISIGGYSKNIQSHFVRGREYCDLISRQRENTAGDSPCFFSPMKSSTIFAFFNTSIDTEISQRVATNLNCAAIANSVSGCLTVIHGSHLNLNNAANLEGFYRTGFNRNVGPQLPFGGILRADNKPSGVPPQERCRYRQDAREPGQDQCESRYRILRSTLPKGFFLLLLVIFVGSCGATFVVCRWADWRDRTIRKPKRTTEDS